MEYITPLIYRKILDTITYIYNKSTNEEDYDLFRFKDVLDSFSEGQLFNKKELVISHQLAMYFDGKIDFGLKSTGSNFCQIGGSTESRAQARSTFEFCYKPARVLSN